VIILSNRGPATFQRRDDGTFAARRGAGGLVSALTPLLTHADEPAAWVAAALTDDDRAAVRAGASAYDGIDVHLLDIDERLARLHYDTVSNQVLWFLYHGLFDLVRSPRFGYRFHEAWDAYTAVNRIFADRVVEMAPAGDEVLVQDLHLALVPGMLRAARPDLRVVHFTHTPFCGPSSIRVLPYAVGRDLCASMASVPCGFHTRRWADAYAAAARTVLDDDAITGGATFVASLGPDPDALAATAGSDEVARAAAELEAQVGDRLVIARSDRVEPSKNIVRGFAAYATLLTNAPEWRGRVVFVAMLYASRQALPEYQAYAQEVTDAAQRVNDRYATGDWQPVLLDTRDDFARTVAGLQRYDALLVNPLRDGLNLVAKEGPLVNQHQGVVCLSEEAGAFDELGDGILPVHPYDLEQTAYALDTALRMDPAERAARAERLRARARARRPSDWLADLRAAARA